MLNMKKGLLGCLLWMWMLSASAQGNIALITPDDGDSIETKNPLLTWSYMGTTVSGDQRNYYRLLMVELDDNQSAEAGIIMNQPILSMERIPGTQLFYPYDAPELKEGIWYAWQVQKIADQVIVDKSEAWKFILPLTIEQEQYYKMKFKNDGVIYIAEDGKIRFEFVEAYQEDALSYYLYNAKQELMNVRVTAQTENEADESTVPLKRYGANYYEIDLGKHALPGTYTLVVLDKKQQRYELKFMVK
jgi:hypothetical protein